MVKLAKWTKSENRERRMTQTEAQRDKKSWPIYQSTTYQLRVYSHTAAMSTASQRLYLDTAVLWVKVDISMLTCSQWKYCNCWRLAGVMFIMFLPILPPSSHKPTSPTFFHFLLLCSPLSLSSVPSTSYFQITSGHCLYTLSHSIPHYSVESQWEGRDRWWKSKVLRERGTRGKKLK